MRWSWGEGEGTYTGQLHLSNLAVNCRRLSNTFQLLTITRGPTIANSGCDYKLLSDDRVGFLKQPSDPASLRRLPKLLPFCQQLDRFSGPSFVSQSSFLFSVISCPFLPSSNPNKQGPRPSLATKFLPSSPHSTLLPSTTRSRADASQEEHQEDHQEDHHGGTTARESHGLYQVSLPMCPEMAGHLNQWHIDADEYRPQIL